MKDINSNQRKSIIYFCSSNVIWMYLKMCALLYYLCLKSFPISSSPSVGNSLVCIVFNHLRAFHVFHAPQWQSASCRDPACWLTQLRDCRPLEFHILSFNIVLPDLLRTFWSNHSCNLLLIVADLMIFISAFHKSDSWAGDSLCLRMGTSHIPSSRHWSHPVSWTWLRHAWAVAAHRREPGPERTMPSGPTALKLHLFIKCLYRGPLCNCF